MGREDEGPIAAHWRSYISIGAEMILAAPHLDCELQIELPAWCVCKAA